MNISPGAILISSPALQDANFEKAVVVIAEHNEKGALGFVVNKLFPRRLNELIEFINAKPFALYGGGPVDTENIFMLHRRNDIIEGSTPLFGNVYMGGDFKQALQHINDGSINCNDIKLFIGYCGWGDKELKAEIEEGSWIVLKGGEEIVFDEREMVWEKLLDKSKL
jgi:putative transcriptional regulator